MPERTSEEAEEEEEAPVPTATDKVEEDIMVANISLRPMQLVCRLNLYW